MMEYYSDFLQKEILSFVTTQMKLQDIILSAMSQIEHKYRMVSFICGIFKKEKKNSNLQKKRVEW